MDKAAKLVSGALLGYDFKTVIIADRAYTIKPPTIKVIAMASYYFSLLEMKGSSFADAISSLKDISEPLTKGVSCFICGSDKLSEELSNGTFDELKRALEVCISFIDVAPFQCVSLMKSVSMLTAREKQ